MLRINFNHLYYFYIVAKEGSIKAAAEKLFVSQPTISDQLKLLEDYFGRSLFERKNRALFLTKEGNLALEYAQKIFSMGQELTSRLKNKIELPKKTIDIGITQYMTQYFLYDYILPFFDQDEFSVCIQEKERHYLLADLEEGKIDILFTDDKDQITSNMRAFRIGINRTYAVAHKKFQKFKKGFPESLNNIPFFNYTNESFLKYEIDFFFRNNGIAPKIIGEADDIDLFQMVTEKGIAFTVVPEVAVKRFKLSNKVVVLGELKDLQTSVWGIIKQNYKGIGYQLLTGRI